MSYTNLPILEKVYAWGQLYHFLIVRVIIAGVRIAFSSISASLVSASVK